MNRPNLFTKTPFPNPSQLGYEGGKTAIAFWWESGGDELAWFDGQIEAVGMGDHWAFLDWLRINDPMGMWDIGSSEDAAINVIFCDLTDNTIKLLPKREAFSELRRRVFGGG